MMSSGGHRAGNSGRRRTDAPPTGLPLSTRVDELLRQRLSFAIRHASNGSIALDVGTARALLSRLRPEATTEVSDEITPK